MQCWNHEKGFLIPYPFNLTCLSVLNGSLDLKAPHMPAAATSTLSSPNAGSVNHNREREGTRQINTGLGGVVLKCDARLCSVWELIRNENSWPYLKPLKPEALEWAWSPVG